MTQGGSWPGALSAEPSAVLGAMGGRGGWHTDALCQATGLPAGAVSAALLELELGGQARRTACGFEAAGRAAAQRRGGGSLGTEPDERGTRSMTPGGSWPQPPPP
ncbi:MAG: hypothetical protein HY744_26530 [Deltaproteobacteria bacterium]|nr:hypothetical protein [Deltaproteobacteria bacterium]